MQRLNGFDGMRALACLMVIGHHLCQKLDPQALTETTRELWSFVLLGEVGVSVFFVLSGTLLALPFWRSWLQGAAPPSLKTYAVKRFSRIAPGFYLALSVSFVLSIYVFDAAVDTQLLTRYLAGLGFVNAFHWVTFFPAESNGPLWSIGFEVIAYVLLVPFMLLMFRCFRKRDIRAGLAYWGLVLSLCAVSHWLLTHAVDVPSAGKGWQFGLIGGAKEWMPYYNPVGMFCHFLLGVIAAGIIGHRQALKSRQRKGYDLAVIAILLGTGLFLFQSRLPGTVATGLLKNIYFWPWFPLAVAISLACLPQTRWVGAWLDNMLLRYIAKISFGFYLWHYLIMDLLARQLFPDFVFSGYTDLSTWLLPSVLTFFLSVLVADCSYRYIEHPVLAWASKRLRSDKAGQAQQNTNSKYKISFWFHLGPPVGLKVNGRIPRSYNGS